MLHLQFELTAKAQRKLLHECIGISTFAILLSTSAEAKQDRYKWIEVPYQSTSPGLTLGGGSNCYGSSSSYNHRSGSAQIQPFGYGANISGSSSNFGGSSGSAHCSQEPTYHIPSSTSRKILRVHIDCKDQTYDAKGDMKGWQSWREEPAVYERAVAACSNSRNLSELSERFEAAKKEAATLAAKSDAVYTQGTITLEQCIKDSLRIQELFSPFLLINPELKGLSSRSQAVRYLAKSKSMIPAGCRKEIKASKEGVSLEESKFIWAEIDSQAIESIIAN